MFLIALQEVLMKGSLKNKTKQERHSMKNPLELRTLYKCKKWLKMEQIEVQRAFLLMVRPFESLDENKLGKV